MAERTDIHDLMAASSPLAHSTHVSAGQGREKGLPFATEDGKTARISAGQT
jgi:hypothetical protein